MDTRPRLVVVGESLGSFGAETAFSGEYDLRNRTAGAIFAGPPNFNVLYREFVDGRDVGSPEVTPVYRGGRTVRFSNDPQSSIPPADRAWDGLGCFTYNTPPTRSSGGAPDSSLTDRTGSTSHGATTSSPPCTGFLWSRSGRSARTFRSPPKFRPGTATCTPANTSTHGRTSSSPPAGRSTMPRSSSDHRTTELISGRGEWCRRSCTGNSPPSRWNSPWSLRPVDVQASALTRPRWSKSRTAMPRPCASSRMVSRQAVRACAGGVPHQLARCHLLGGPDPASASPSVGYFRGGGRCRGASPSRGDARYLALRAQWRRRPDPRPPP